MIDFDGKSDYVKGNGFTWSDRDPVLTFDNRTDAEEYAFATWNQSRSGRVSWLIMSYVPLCKLIEHDM